MSERVFCVTGIDTDIGKTVVTGLIAKSLLKKGIKVITQKIAQTGCEGISEDIVAHRKLMEIDLYDVDHAGLTCPYLFSQPCSPHLAAKIDGGTIDITTIRKSTDSLLEQFDCVLLEGAGGLSVPLTEDFTLLDYLTEEKYPLILVSGSRLGSINHTLNALELAKWRNLEVAAIVYNCFAGEDERIEQDSKLIFEHYMTKFDFSGPVIKIMHLSYYDKKGMGLPDLSRAVECYQKRKSINEKIEKGTGPCNKSNKTG
jgi:dethiobiotin synthetase